MTKLGLRYFQGKRVLLLQGPVGPFFRRLAVDLRNAGAEVTKVNFNGGDWIFYPDEAIAYRGRLAEWGAFCEKLLREQAIDLVLLFGDCRPIHKIAREVAARLEVEVGVFEEGYVRPDYVTLESGSVNGNSQLPRDPDFYYQMPMSRVERPDDVGEVFWHAMAWAMIYYGFSALAWPVFPAYRHHRPLHIFEGLFWLRSFYRKPLYKMRESGFQQQMETVLSGRYYLVPLQVHNDAQLFVHSDFVSVLDFIRFVLESFASRAPGDTCLVIKHHPLDRGYTDYTEAIRSLSRRLKLEGRVFYIHDQHLPSVIRHSRGVVLINSTVGLSALRHNAPLKACGKAIYDMEGLTFQGELDDFWTNARPPDEKLFRRYRSYVIEQTQVNGNFYKALSIPGFSSGLRWNRGPVATSTFHAFSPIPEPEPR